MSDHLNRQIELGGHAPNHQQLLIVLRPEHGDIRLHHVEQLGDDGGDAAEMPWPTSTAQGIRQPWNLDEGLAVASVRIDLRFIRREQAVIARLRQQFRITLERARIRVQILGGAELQGVDEDTGDDPIRPR